MESSDIRILKSATVSAANGNVSSINIIVLYFGVNNDTPGCAFSVN